ncbi:MAG: DNA polymerase III subunit epsilon [Gammaproteobacteria bacterium]|nr:DNA polymerase III subunit epsilon [Gammaproteobacteria bacterium]
MTRQIVLDTETTGLSPSDGHRVIEIGCVELLNRRYTGNNFHAYLNPERQIDLGAMRVHGISNEFLKDKPRFVDMIDDFINYIRGAELIIHNATFDVGFLNHEFKLSGSQYQSIEKISGVFDTLPYARRLHPGQKNSLDALCKRYNVNNSNRQLHGALLDAELLAHVYLAMTGGQVTMFGDASDTVQQVADSGPIIRNDRQHSLPVIVATAEELEAHQQFMESIV